MQGTITILHRILNIRCALQFHVIYGASGEDMLISSYFSIGKSGNNATYYHALFCKHKAFHFHYTISFLHGFSHYDIILFLHALSLEVLLSRFLFEAF